MHNRTVLALQTNESLWRSVRAGRQAPSNAGELDQVARSGQAANDAVLMARGTILRGSTAGPRSD